MWSDNECQDDYLGRGDVVRATSALVRRPELLPLSIGIFGDWGSGKSTLLRLIKADLERPAEGDGRFLVVEFDAWLYQGFDDTRAALMEVIADALVEAADARQGIVDKAKDLAKRVDHLRLFGKIGRLALDYAAGAPVATGVTALWNAGQRIADTGSLTAEEMGLAREAADGIASEAKEVLKERVARTPPREIAAFRARFNEVLDDLGRTLVVIVDNLDRCLPESTIEALEAIRLFLFMNRTAFVIAADQAMVQNAVKRHYGAESASHAHFYLDKFIQVPLRLPYAGTAEVRTFLYLLYAEAAGLDAPARAAVAEALAGLNAEGNRPVRDRVIAAVPGLPEALPAQFDLADRLAPVLASAPGIHGNPRIIKRLMNAARIRKAVAADRGLTVDEELIVKVTLFERCAPDGFADLLELIAPDGLETLLSLEAEAGSADTAPAGWTGLPERWKGVSPAFLKAWFTLAPSFREANPAPVLYLCREVLALSGSVVLLTGRAREAFEVLAKTDRVQSPVAEEVIAVLSPHDASAVMGELIVKLRRAADWKRRVPGVTGAIRLAQAFPAEGAVLASFLSGLSPRPPWLTPLVEREPWAAQFAGSADARKPPNPMPSAR